MTHTPTHSVLPDNCPKCGGRLITNNRGIECGELRCDYNATTHTPLPWFVAESFCDNGASEGYQILSKNDGETATFTISEDNADYIVKCVNEHEGLVEMLHEYRVAQSRMKDRWAEGDKGVKSDLWKNLHSLEERALDLLEKAK